MKIDITKRIEWLSKRIVLSEHDKDYIRFQLQEAVLESVKLIKKQDMSNVQSKWFWMMDYCKINEIPAGQAWAWKEAEDAWYLYQQDILSV